MVGCQPEGEARTCAQAGLPGQTVSEPQRDDGGAASGAVEHLTGAEGREVFFRPERYGADAFGLVQPVVHVTDGEGDAAATFECRLHDVSQNGVAFRWERGTPPPTVGMTLPRLRVAFDGHVAYDGSARISSVREDGAALLVGAAFVDSLMDVDDVLRLRDVRAWETRRAPKMTLAGKAWHVAGHLAFKAHVSEFRLFLEDAVEELDALEKEFPSHLLYRDVDSAARAGLIKFVRSQFVRPLIEYSEHIDAILRDASSADWQILREYSHRQIQHLLIRSQFFRRSLHKPLGYPGDYLVLSWIYEHGFEGPHLFDRAMDHGQLAFTAAQAVRNRKDLLTAMLRERVRAPRPGGEPLRIVSVASGPAQEFVEFVEALVEPPQPVEIVLFDQDKESLTYAYGRLRRLVDRRFPTTVRVTFLHDSIRRLLHDPAIFDSFGPFDIVICAGLFDYLALRTAQALASKLHGELREGGVAWIGNMHPSNPSRWLMEMHADWHLMYRTAEELLDLGLQAAGEGRATLAEEPTGVNPFLVLRR